MWSANRINAVDIWATRHGGSSSRERGSETPPQISQLPPQMANVTSLNLQQQICTSKHVSPIRRRVEPDLPVDLTILQRGVAAQAPIPLTQPLIVSNPQRDSEVSQLKGQIHKLEREISRLSIGMEGIAEDASKNVFMKFRESLLDDVKHIIVPNLMKEQEKVIKNEVQRAAGFNDFTIPVREVSGALSEEMYASRKNSRIEEKPYSRRSTALSNRTEVERDPLPSPTRRTDSVNFQGHDSNAPASRQRIADVVEELMIPHQSRVSKIEHNLDNGVSEQIQSLQELVASHLEPQMLKMNELEGMINRLRSSASENMIPVGPLPTAAEHHLAPPPLQSINLQVPELREEITSRISQEVPSIVRTQVEQMLRSDIPVLVVSKVQDEIGQIPEMLQSQVDRLEGTLDAKVAQIVHSEMQHELQGGGGLTPIGSMVSNAHGAFQESDVDAVALRVKGDVQKTVEQAVRKQVHEQLTVGIRQQMDERIQAEVANEVARRASSIVSHPSVEVSPEIEMQLKAHTSHIPQQIRTQVKSQLQDQLSTNVKSQVRDQLQEQLTTGLHQQIQNTIQSHVQRQINREMDEQNVKLQKLEYDLNGVRGDLSDAKHNTAGVGVTQLEARVQGLEISSAWQPPPPPPPSEPAEASQFHVRHEQQARLDDLALKIENLNEATEEARDLRTGLSSRLAAIEAAPRVNDVERNLHRRIDEIIDHRSKLQSSINKFDSIDSSVNQSANIKRRLDGIENQTSKVQELASVNKSIMVRLEMLESQPAHQELKRRVDELTDTRGAVNTISARLETMEELTSAQALERGVQRHVSDRLDPVVDKMGNVERAVVEIERRMSTRIDQLSDNKVSAAQISARLDNLDTNISYCYNLQKRVDEIDRTTCKISTIDDRVLPRVKAVEDQVLPRLSALESDIPSRLRHVEEQLPKFSTIEEAVIPRVQSLEDSIHLRVSGLEDRVLPRIKTIEDQLPRYKKLLDTDLPKLSSAEEALKQKVKQLEDTLIPKVRSIDSVVVPRIRAAEGSLTQKLLGLEERILPRVELVEDQLKNSRVSASPMSEIHDHVSTQIGDYNSMISARMDQLQNQTSTIQDAIMPAIQEKISVAHDLLNDKISKLEALQPTIEDHVSAVQSRLSTKIDNIEATTLPTIKNHISQVESDININLNKMNESMANIQNQTNQLLPKVNNQLKTHMSSVEQQLDTVQHTIIPLKVKELQSHIGGVESKVDHFENTVVPLKVKEQLSGVKGEIHDKIAQIEEKVKTSQTISNKETDLKIQRLEKKNESLEKAGSQLAQAIVDEDSIKTRLSIIESQGPAVQQQISALAEQMPVLQGVKVKVDDLESRTTNTDSTVETKILPRLKVIEKSLLNLQDSSERNQEELQMQKQPEPDLAPRIKTLEDSLPQSFKAVENNILPRLLEIEQLIPDIKKDLKKPSQIQEMLTPLIKIVEGQVMPRLQAVETSIPDLNAILETVKKLRNDNSSNKELKDLNTLIGRLQTGLVAVATQQEKTKEECAMVCGSLRNEVAALKTQNQQQRSQQQPQFGSNSSRISPSRRH